MSFREASGKQISSKEDYVLNPVRLVKRWGISSEVWSLRKPNLPDEESYEGVLVRRFPGTASLLWNLFKEKNVALVLAHLRPYPPAILSPLTGKPSILIPHTYELGSNWLIKKISLFLMKRFKKVIALTPYERGLYLSHGLKEKKVILLPHAIDVDFFSRAPKASKASIQKKFGIRKQDFIVTSISNFRKFKNLDTIIEAFALFNQKCPSSRLLIVGENQLNNPRYKDQSASRFKDVRGPDEMISQHQLNGKVIFTGGLNFEGVREALHISNIFVNNSDPETMGISVYEAAAAGIPLCLPSIPSFTAVFGSHALYSPPRDPEQLAKVFKQYCSQPALRESMRRRLRQFISQFDYPVFMKKLEALYQGLISSR